MNLLKLQSEAVKELKKKFPYIKADIGDKLYKEFETLISNQLIKAYSKGREEIEPFKTFLLN